MQGVDWFDTLFHGAPWIMLIVSLVYTVVKGQKQEKGITT